MGKRILTLMLLLAVIMAGCSSGGEESAAASPGTEPVSSASALAPASASEAQPPAAGTAAHKTAPADEPALSMGEYSSSMVVYTYYFSSLRANLINQAHQNGFTDEDMGAFWDIVQEGQTIRELLEESAEQVTKEHAILYKMATDAGTAPDAEADTASDERADRFLEDIGGDEQAFIDEYYLTPAQMKEIGRRINLVDAYQEDILAAQEVTEDELLAAYEANRDAYDVVTVRHILIMAEEGATEEEVAAAETKANDLLARIQNGEDIGALAAEFSEDGGSQSNNGEYVFGRGEMVAPFEDWAFAAKVGDQGVVRTSYGFHVMELMKESSFGNVRDFVEEDARVEKARVVFAEIPELTASPDWVAAPGVGALEA